MSTVREWTETIITSVEKVIYGKRDVIQKLLIAFLCRGHVLLEDVPGVGKTILARAISASLGGTFRRVQCTPDLLPADVLGVSVYNQKTGVFDFKEGPIMTNLLLVDEVNRATPRTQSAMLEAMEERKISVEGRTRELPDPFIILATENPVEFEGTFPLPEAQKDRFFLSLRMGYPPSEAEMEIMVAQRRLTHPVTDVTAVTDTETVREMQSKILEIEVPSEVEEYILALVDATRKEQLLQLGASPRASIALYKGSQALAAIRGQSRAVIEHVQEIAGPVFFKRITVKSENQLRGISEEKVIRNILERTEVPTSAL